MDAEPFSLNPERIRTLLKQLNTGLVEREEIIQLSLLTVLSGQSVFLHGPPGTAKSLIAIRISSAIKDSRFFEYLMQRFSTPEEIFGPISISELKQDRYVRRTEGFLPEADIAFLDEIWKSNPAILNTLLTIINERKFRNGNDVIKVPLKAIIAASNEFPAENSGLEALYDRFITRLKVPPIRTKKGFDTMLAHSDVPARIEVTQPITNEEWNHIISHSGRITIPKDVLSVIDLIRKAIKSENNQREESPIYVSDRRWQRAVSLMRTSAYICRKDSVSVIDCFLLINCLWSRDSDRDVIEKIVTEAIASRFSSKITGFNEWKTRFTDLDERITRFLDTTIAKFELMDYVPSDVLYYRNDQSLHIQHKDMDVYIPMSRIRSGGSFVQNCKRPDGSFISLAIKARMGGKDRVDLTIGNTEYSVLMTKESVEEMEAMCLRFADTLNALEKELNELDAGFGDGALLELEDISPFIPERYIEKLKDTVSGGRFDMEKSKNRIAELWRRLDEHRGV